MALRPSSEGVADCSLGPLIRMRALEVGELPAHPVLASQQKAAPNIQTLVSSALEEANTFMTTYLPKHFVTKSDAKQSPPSSATVKVLSHDIKASDLPQDVREAGAGDESWFARSSIHENAEKTGTASWKEFDEGLRQNHSQHEMDYTPSVLDANELLNYKSQLDASQGGFGGWEDVQAGIMEMLHEIPTPLNNRVFYVLVICAKRDSEFIDLQIPVDPQHLPNTKYMNESKIVRGIYTSVERGELLENDTKVRWQMATASNAGGSLPMWAQKMGLPGAVVKDVGFFMDWRQKERKAQSAKSV